MNWGHLAFIILAIICHFDLMGTKCYSTFQIYLEESDDVAALVHMYKSMENHLDERFGPVEDFFRDDYFLASISDQQR